MIALVVTICSALSGTCEDRTVPLVAGATPLACMLRAQAIVADPRAFDLRGDWRVARWECRS